jgi:hypothetical protein
MQEKEIIEKLSVDFNLIRDSNGILNIPRTLESFQSRFDELKKTISNHILNDSSIRALIIEIFAEAFESYSPENYLHKQYIITSILNKVSFSKDNIRQISEQLNSFIKNNSSYGHGNNLLVIQNVASDDYSLNERICLHMNIDALSGQSTKNPCKWHSWILCADDGCKGRLYQCRFCGKIDSCQSQPIS